MGCKREEEEEEEEEKRTTGQKQLHIGSETNALKNLMKERELRYQDGEREREIPLSLSFSSPSSHISKAPLQGQARWSGRRHLAADR